MRKSVYAVLTPIVAISLSACFASQADIRVLQSDLMLIRNEAYLYDSVRSEQLAEVIKLVARTQDQILKLNDSVAVVNSRLIRFRSDMSESMSSVEQQLLQIQELTGQSQRRLQEMRTSLESRDLSEPIPVEPGGQPRRSDTPAQGESGTPGPNELYRIAQQMYNQGSYSSARSAFQDLLDTYPKADIAVDAQYYIADSYAAEGNTAAADSAYAVVVSKYPKSNRAPAALYKRAIAAATSGKNSDARKLFNEVIKKYGASDEATLAKERLQMMDRND